MMTNPSMQTRLTLASRSDRLFGQAIDGLVGGAPILLTALIPSVPQLFDGALLWIGILWAVFYHFFADGLPGGQSFGKKWIGTYVINATTGAPCTFGASFVRNLLTILGPIDWLFIFGERHQRLGDKAAGTIVVYD